MTAVEFNELVYTASKSLKIPALKFTHNHNDANDLIQDTILKALRNRTKFKSGTNIKAWLYIIMKILLSVITIKLIKETLWLIR